MSANVVMSDAITGLEEQVRTLTEQLQFARQKASLYYITASELESVKRGSEILTMERKDVATCTADDSPTVLTPMDRIPAETQTEIASTELANTVQLQAIQAENEQLRTSIDTAVRTEAARVHHQQILERIRTEVGSGDSTNPDWIAAEYASLFEDFLTQNRTSVNHSVEVKRRDQIISSLFEKIRLMESAFSQKLIQTENLANSRQAVISELGEQVKDAMRVDREQRESSSDEGISWKDMAAMHSELEDLRAELSKARTNWAATRDELIRLQFRVGSDGNGKSSTEYQSEYPQPVLALLDAGTREKGVISAIRSIRYRGDTADS